MSETMKKRYANCAKYMPRAKICSGCAAIIGRGEETYPDNHWPWCPGGEAMDITPEAAAAARANDPVRRAGSRSPHPGVPE